MNTVLDTANYAYNTICTNKQSGHALQHHLTILRVLSPTLASWVKVLLPPYTFESRFFWINTAL